MGSPADPSHAPISFTTVIRLDDALVARALPKVAPGLEKYRWLQAELQARDVARDREFQRRFNAFYRVRRNEAWRDAFYELFEREKSDRRPFSDVLRALYDTTGRTEASFTSKLVASVDPDLPVIDAFVLKNLGLRLPYSRGIEERLIRLTQLHDHIRSLYSDYVDSHIGRRLVATFEYAYPGSGLTPVKMLDLVLWQAR